MPTLPSAPAAPTAPAASGQLPEQRPPDVVCAVIEWKGELKETAIKSRGIPGVKEPVPKFVQMARVRNPANGKEADVPVYGTSAQWEVCDPSHVEGYKGSDGTTLYFQPALMPGGVSADSLM